MSALAASGLPPGRLDLEITEALLLHHDDKTIQTLHQLRSLGIGISMDDFGTGYSSLSYLRMFPFSKVKIDRSFVRDLTTDKSSMAIIRAILSMIASVGITSVAEGVETPEQLQWLQGESCTEAQGYFISRPVPSRDLTAFFRDKAKVDSLVA